MDQAIQKLSNHYILCGGGRSGSYILDELLKTNRQCVLIEKDPEKTKGWIEKNVLVVTGDATQDSFLQEAGIEKASGLVTTLSSDKDNLFVVITARGLNPKLRIVSKTEEKGVRDKFLRSGADSAVSASFIGGLRMVSELVRPEAVSFLDSMLRGDSTLRVEDVRVAENSRMTHKTLGNAQIPSKTGVVLLSLRHGDTYQFNPPPETTLQSGDTLVVIGNPEQIKKVHNILNP